MLRSILMLFCAQNLSFVVIKRNRQDLPVCLVIIDHSNNAKDPYQMVDGRWSKNVEND